MGLARITFGITSEGNPTVNYQGSWILFYGSEEIIGNFDPKKNSVERNGKWVSLSKLERIASSWWGFKPDWDEYFQENGYDPHSGLASNYVFMSMALGLYPEDFMNAFSDAMGQIAELAESAEWEYITAGLACGGGASPFKGLNSVGKPGRSPKVRLVSSEAELRKLFDEISSGGKVIPSGSYPGISIEMPNKYIIRFRQTSKSGGATIDVSIGNINYIKIYTE